MTGKKLENWCGRGNDDNRYDVTQVVVYEPGFNTTIACGGLPSPSSTNVNNWPALRILFRLPQNFMRYGRSIAFTESDVLQQVRQRVPFAPTKINVRKFSGFISQKKQESSNRIGHGRRHGAQDAKTVYTFPVICSTPENSDASPGVTSKKRIGSLAGM